MYVDVFHGPQERDTGAIAPHPPPPKKKKPKENQEMKNNKKIQIILLQSSIKSAKTNTFKCLQKIPAHANRRTKICAS
jgi:hypothetical protein